MSNLRYLRNTAHTLADLHRALAQEEELLSLVIDDPTEKWQLPGIAKRLRTLARYIDLKAKED